MKHFILIIAALIVGNFNAQAKSFNNQATTSEFRVLNEDPIVEVFDWHVKTTTGVFSGTAATLFDAKRRSNLVGQGEVVLEQMITSYFVLKSDLQAKAQRLFFWEVSSSHGYAKGFSQDEASARLMIARVAQGDIISYNIITNTEKK